MAKQRESVLVGSIRKSLEARGWLTWKNHGGPYMQSGLPDVMAVKAGRLLAVEVKVPGNKASAIQQRLLARLAAQGAVTVVAYSVDDVLNAIDRAEGTEDAGQPAAPLAASVLGSGERAT